MKNSVIICDVETGGLEPTEHPITQITMEVVDPNNFQSLHYFETFVQPYNNLQITPKALEMSRVTMQQVNSGIDKNALMKGLVGVFKAANKSGRDTSLPYFVGHNFGFDIAFIEYFFTYFNKQLYASVQRVMFDTMAMMRLFEGDRLKGNEGQRYTLTECCVRAGIVLRNAHGSGADVAATKALFIYLTNLQRNAITTNDPASPSGSTTKRMARPTGYFQF